MLQGHQHRVFAIDAWPDDQTVASVGLDGDLRLWWIGAKEPSDSSTNQHHLGHGVEFTPPQTTMSWQDDDLPADFSHL